MFYPNPSSITSDGITYENKPVNASLVIRIEKGLTFFADNTQKHSIAVVSSGETQTLCYATEESRDLDFDALDALIDSPIRTETDNLEGLLSDIIDLLDRVIPIKVEENENPIFVASATFQAVNNATDIFYIRGSATKTVKILKIEVSISASSGNGGTNTISIIRRSSANGTNGTAITCSKYDSAEADATATAAYYTANPSTLGTAAATLHVHRYTTEESASVGEEFEESYDLRTKLPTLRGTSELLAINLGGTAIANNTTTVYVTFSEV